MFSDFLLTWRYFFLILLCGAIVASREQFRVGIIGGGIGGTSTAYWLRQSFGDDVHLDVYTDEAKVGGRLATMRIDNREYEIGGSIIHPDNYYMVEWLKELGLEKRQSPTGIDRLGIWNGEEFVFEESRWLLITMTRMLWRYGLDVLTMKSSIDELLMKFAKVYRLQRDGAAFDTAAELIQAIDRDFVILLNMTMQGYALHNRQFRQHFIDEMIAAIINCNYGQSVDGINAFVGSVGLAGAVPDLWAVKGGNRRIPEALVEYSKANLLTNHRVRHIRKIDKNLMSIECVDENNNRIVNDATYDVVILAIPLHQGGGDIVIDDVDLSKYTANYEPIVATLVRGSPRFANWKRHSDHDLPDSILVCDSNHYYKSLGQLADVDWIPNSTFPLTGDERVWKVFSSESLTTAQLDQLFMTVVEKDERRWLAYPHYANVPLIDSFILADNVYHVNAIEWTASAMEMSAIGAKNVANLIIRKRRKGKNANKRSTLVDEL